MKNFQPSQFAARYVSLIKVFFKHFRFFRILCLPQLLILTLPLVLHTADSSEICSSGHGASICGRNLDIGSNQLRSLPSTLIGNPIDAINANKFQTELDFAMPDSPLSLFRHYNSINADLNIGLGYGWTMSYFLRLKKLDSDTLQITQSDGRRITFSRSASSAMVKYISLDASDGYIISLGKYRHWILPDKRVWIFRGPFPVKLKTMNFNEINLHYKNNSLSSATDHKGNKIEFLYNSKHKNRSTIAGILLPSGQTVNYIYDSERLTGVLMNKERLRTYHYESQSSNTLLTGVSDSQGNRVNRTWYDSSGLPVRTTNHVTEQDVTLEYHQPPSSDTYGFTYITGAQGETGKYTWSRSTSNNGNILRASTVSQCPDCRIQSRQYHYNKSNLLEYVTRTDGSNLKFKDPQQLPWENPPHSSALSNRPSTLQAQTILPKIDVYGRRVLIDDSKPAFPVSLQRSVFGTVQSVKQHINIVDFRVAETDLDYLKNPDNLRASSFALIPFIGEHSPNNRSLEAMDNCEYYGPDADNVVDVLNEISLEQQANSTEEHSCGDNQDNIATQSEPTIPGGHFRDARTINCLSYFDVYFGTNRGFRIEDGFATHPDFANGISTSRRFPVVDFLQNREAIAIKSRDLRTPTYNDPEYPDSLYQRLMRDAREMREEFLDPVNESGIVSTTEGILTTTIRSEDFNRFRFELIIQHNVATAQQQQQILDAQVDIYSLYGIQMQVVEIP